MKKHNISAQKDYTPIYRNRIIFLIIAAAEILCTIGIFAMKNNYLSKTRANESGFEIKIIMPIFIVIKIFSAAANIAAVCIKNKRTEKTAFIMSCYINGAEMLIGILCLTTIILMAVTMLPALIWKDFYEGLTSIANYFFFNIEFFVIPFLISFLSRKKKN